MTSVPRWMIIARREFLERVRTKWFVIGTLLGPVVMLAIILIPAILARSGGDKNKIALVDRSGTSGRDIAIAAKLQTAFGASGWNVTFAPDGATDEELRTQIASEKLNSFLVIPSDPLVSGKYIYRGDNAVSQEVLKTVYTVVTAVVLPERGKQMGLSPQQIQTLVSPPTIETLLDNGESEGSSGVAAFVVGYAVMFILYMAIVLYGVNVMRSVVEEKTSRVVELMVAATKPRDLMAGKIIGVGSVGLVQLTIWLAMALLTITYRDALLSLFGASSGGIKLPPITVLQIVIVLAYFVLGYFFYAAIYAAVGAMVSSDQEAQQAQMPVSLLLLIPATCISLVANDPRGTTATALTMIPFSSPTLMPMRYLLGGTSTLGLLLSLGILFVATIIVGALSAKIYRVGILMYGKRPSARELLRWLRH